ncbi:MAG TPA: hypothetical protein VMK12_24710 [Anaeromyxobacteraceae bacterium]|nr:hypothetical protein [Anaeromyxobacteraceae bacterium]
MNNVGGEGIALWDPEDEFFFDVLRCPSGGWRRLKLRSLVGLIPLFAVEVLADDQLTRAPEFATRLRWFLRYRPDLAGLVSRWNEPGRGEIRLLALLRGHRMMFRPEELTLGRSALGTTLSARHEKAARCESRAAWSGKRVFRRAAGPAAFWFGVPLCRGLLGRRLERSRDGVLQRVLRGLA